jgi:hypothetical protein
MPKGPGSDLSFHLGQEGDPSKELPGILRDPGIARARKWNTDIPNILPHERVFPIQIGCELFRLSGASISSDGLYPHAASCSGKSG